MKVTEAIMVKCFEHDVPIPAELELIDTALQKVLVLIEKLEQNQIKGRCKMCKNSILNINTNARSCVKYGTTDIADDGYCNLWE